MITDQTSFEHHLGLSPDDQCSVQFPCWLELDFKMLSSLRIIMHGMFGHISFHDIGNVPHYCRVFNRYDSTGRKSCILSSIAVL